jgi:hypothetical protein
VSLSCSDRSTFTLEIPGGIRGGSSETRTYARLDESVLSATSSDPFSGYFMGSFGSHGPELLHLQRGLWDGEEAVIAHKVTGTAPSPRHAVNHASQYLGTVLFRAAPPTKGQQQTCPPPRGTA